MADRLLRMVERRLEALALADRRFDLVVAVRVGLFRRRPAEARALVAPWLAPGGRVVVEDDEPVRRDPSGGERLLLAGRPAHVTVSGIGAPAPNPRST